MFCSCKQLRQNESVAFCLRGECSELSIKRFQLVFVGGERFAKLLLLLDDAQVPRFHFRKIVQILFIGSVGGIKNIGVCRQGFSECGGLIVLKLVLYKPVRKVVLGNGCKERV